MALKYVTSIQPAGVALYVEEATPGVPTDTDPVIGSIAIVVVAGSVRTYIKTTAFVWEEIAQVKALTTGVLGVPMVLPVTLAAGNGTTTVTLPARSGGWRVIDFWLTNSSGGAGAGTVTVQRGSDSAAITDAVAPGAAANDITRAADLLNANAVIAGGGTIEYVRAGGFTAAASWTTIIPL